jgi:uncharacterized protein (DUF885 family)
MRTSFLIVFTLALLFSCKPTTEHAVTKQESSELSSIFDSIEKFSTTSGDSVYRGYHPKKEWASRSYASQMVEADTLQKYIQALDAIDDVTLSAQEKISEAVMLTSLGDQVDNVKYKMMFIPFDAEGGFYNGLSNALNNLPFRTAQDYYDYLAWLPRYEASLKENIELMRQGLKEGIIAPKIIVNNQIDLLKPWVVNDFRNSPFYHPLAEMPASINETDRTTIAQQSEKTISSLVATYKIIQDFFVNEYLPVAKEQPGISVVPGGKEYYENRIRHYTTLPLTPDSIHNLGLSEVARIRAAMNKIIEEVKFKGSFADFLKFLRTDKQFYAKTPQELLSHASWLSKKAEGQLPRLFNKLYNLPFTVEPVPASIAPTYTGGRYVPGSWERQRPGIYWVNTYNLSSRTLYTLPALTLHEAVPGHHLQISLASEIKDIPRFRTRYYISAFGEGWGLYSEYLGEEMGMYTTPYELFGRYTYEMWRACRLVVDTGIHYKGWTRDEALKFLRENTALSLHEVTTEIDRYIGWPGQAVSYKVGELKIKQLRKKAEEALSTRFNLGDFHNAILQNGSVPLSLLEAQVDDYINRVFAEQ